MVTSAMPHELPPCGRLGCVQSLQHGKHRHEDWAPGDRVVVEPKLATAPGWAYSSPRGVGVERKHSVQTTDVVTVQLDGETDWREVDWHLLTRQRTYDQRETRRTRRKPPTEKKRKEELDPEKYDEPTLGDWLSEEMAAGR